MTSFSEIEKIESLLNLIDSAAFFNAAEKVPNRFWKLSDKELETEVAPSKTARQLRVAFWTMVRRTLTDGGKIKLSDLCALAGCTQARAYQLFKDRPEILAWLMRPAYDLHSNIDPIMSDLGDRLSEISRLPITDSKGKLIAENAKAILRLVEVLGPQLNK